MQWNFSIDKQFGPNWLLTTSYLGNRTNHLWLGYDAHAPIFVPGTDCANSNNVKPTHGTGTSACSTTRDAQNRPRLTEFIPPAWPFLSSLSRSTDEAKHSTEALPTRCNDT